MNQDQLFIWKSSLGVPISWVEWSLGISKASHSVSQFVGVLDMAAACQLCGSVGGGFRKGKMASACLDARYFSLSQYTTGGFQAATLVLELRASEFE